jgi:septum formation protein
VIITNNNPLVLASSSPYRADLLAKLDLPVIQDTPDIDETPLPGETATAIALRLSIAKARKVAQRHDSGLIIASDQVASQNGVSRGKPGDIEIARRQLAKSSGRWVKFVTGLCVLDPCSSVEYASTETFEVLFRKLSSEQIENYLQRERPFDCAGSFKAEGLGISLFKQWRGRDSNCLVGLPLMLLIDFLENFGIDILGSTQPLKK